MLSRLFGRRLHPSVYHLYTRESEFPFLCRPGSSDRDVFAQTFVRRQFERLDYPSDPTLIVDCGANVGYVSRYFLSRFPTAHVLAVEPDRQNFDILRRNVEPYGRRVSTICAAVWSRSTRLLLCRGTHGDGREWATRVRECVSGEEADVTAMDIPALLAESGFAHIDILKIDVEGAEVHIFAPECRDWLDKVEMIIIELHDEQCRETFFGVLGPERFRLSVSGDLTVAKRLSATETKPVGQGAPAG